MQFEEDEDKSTNEEESLMPLEEDEFLDDDLAIDSELLDDDLALEESDSDDDEEDDEFSE